VGKLSTRAQAQKLNPRFDGHRSGEVTTIPCHSEILRILTKSTKEETLSVVIEI
jgi:hypothetical protein